MSRSMKRFVFFNIYFFCSYIDVCFQLDAFIREHVWHEAMLMGYSLRLGITCVCSLNGFPVGYRFFFYEGPSSLFLRVYFP